MAETGAIASAVAREIGSEQPSKAELQRRMEDAREAITGTVTEIKESVVHQYEAVKETVDWREQFKKRPAALTVGAVGAGLFVGWRIASVFRDKNRTPAPAGFVTSSASTANKTSAINHPEEKKSRTGDETPTDGLLKRFASSPMYKEIRDEGTALGKGFLGELSKIGSEVLVPAIIGKIRKWLSAQLDEDNQQQAHSAKNSAVPQRGPRPNHPSKTAVDEDARVPERLN